MRHRIFDRLRPVLRRQRLLAVYSGLAYGLVAGSAVGGMFRLAMGQPGRPVPPMLTAAVLVFGPLLGCFFAALSRLRWHAAAAAVDRHHHLKDRSVTALEFLTVSRNDRLSQLQVE